MTAKLAKIVLSIIVGIFGLVLVMSMLAGVGPVAAREEIGESGGGALAASEPYVKEMDASPGEIRADGASTSTIVAKVYSGCNALPGAFVAFTTSLGTIDPYCYTEAEDEAVSKSDVAQARWHTETLALASGGGQVVRACGTSDPNAVLSWTFQATAISMLHIKDHDGGVAEVQVDGRDPITVPMCDGTTTAAERVIATGLDPESQHTVTVRLADPEPACPGGNCIWIDAFRCGDTTDENGEGTATLTSIDLSCESKDATVTAIVGDLSISSMITEITSVRMTASVPATVTVTASPFQIVANGVSTTTLTAVVEDQFVGEYVPDCTMVGFVATDENGAWITLPYELVEGEDPTEVITGGWAISDTASHHGGYAIYTNTARLTASWDFTGTAVSLIYPKLSDAGVATVTVDSGLPITIDMYASLSSEQYQVEHVITDTLIFGSHVITVEVAGITGTVGATDKRVYVDAFRSGTRTSGGIGEATAVLTAGTKAGVLSVEAAAVGRQCCEVYGDSVKTDTVSIALTAGPPHTLIISPTDGISITCCATETLQFTVTDEYSNVVGAVVPMTLTVDFTSTPYGDFLPTSSVEITDGVGSVEVHGWMSGTGTITGTVSGYPVTGTLNLTVLAGSCHTLTVNVSPTLLYATDENTDLLADFPYTSTTTARVTDICENPVKDGTVVTFTTNLGSVSPVTQTTVNGWVTTTLTSQQISGPTQTATIVVTGCSVVTDTTAVTFGRHVYTLTVRADPDEMGVGGYTSTLTADVDDGFGGSTPDGVMVGFTITPSIRASVPYEYVEAEDAIKVTAPGWPSATAVGVTYIHTDTVGAWASWNFTGTAVSFIYHQGLNRGTVTVTIDSPAYTRVIDMSGTDDWVERVITTGLTLASRNVTVTVETTGTDDTEIDAFRSGATISGGAGRATATATSGTRPGVATFEAAAIGSAVTNTGQITTTAGDPATLVMTPPDINLTCCNTETLQFTVTDQYGNQVGLVSPQQVDVCLKCTGTDPDLVDTLPDDAVEIVTGTGSVELHGYKVGTGTIEGWLCPSLGVKQEELEELEKRDYRRLGWELDVFSTHKVSSVDLINDTSNITVTAGSLDDGGRLTVTRAPVAIPASLKLDTSIITATVEDSCENLLCNETVTFTTSLGYLDPIAETRSITSSTGCSGVAKGVATATLTSECSSGTANITVTADSLITITYVVLGGVVWNVDLVANPASIQVDGHTSILTATVTDYVGNPVDTDVIFETSRGSLGSDTVTRPTVNGVATATLTSGTEAGTATITATADTVIVTTTVEFTPLSPHTVTLACPTSLTVGYTSTLSARVTDRHENNVANNTVVTFTTSLGELGSYTTTKTTTDGVATAVLTASNTVGMAIITAASGSAITTTAIAFEPDFPYTVTLEANPTSLTVDYSSSLTATVKDQYSNLVSDNTVVAFTTSLGNLSSDTATTTDGIATATLTSQEPGTATITATIGITSAVKTVVFSVGSPATVALVADPPSLIAGGASTLSVTVTDQYDNLVGPTVVTFTTSLGSLGSDTGLTIGGVVTTVLTSGTEAGTAFITATADSKVGMATVEFMPLSPYTVTLVADLTEPTVGETSSLTATVKDQYDNLVGPTVVTFTTSFDSLSSETITKTTSSGVATTTLTSQKSGTATITATIGMTSAIETVVFSAGSPAIVTLEADPESIWVGSYTSTLTVTVTDQYTNPVANNTVVTFTTSLGNLGSDTGITIGGVVTTVLTSETEVGTAIITAASDSQVATTTVEFKPGSPYTLTLVARPMTLTVGESSTLTATVKDQYDNNVADRTVVTFTTSLGEVGSTEVTKTTTSGVATAELTSQVPGTATVTVTADPVSDTVDVTFEPGLPYTVTLEANPTSILVGGFTSTLTVTVKDQYDNNVADETSVLFETSLGSLGSVTVTKFTANGVATATLTSGETAGTAVVTATSDSKYGTANVTFNPDLPYTMTVEAYPTSILIGGFTSDIAATVRDQYDNLVAYGTAVFFETSLGSLGSVTVTKYTADGVATATLTSDLIIGTANITATSGSAEGQTQVIFIVGAPYTITVESWPPTIEVGGSTATITATVTDVGGYPVADDTPVVFTTDFASLGSSTATKYTTDGVAVATLTSGTTPGVAHITATADSKFDTATVKVAAGPPFSIDVTADPTHIPIGGATSLITATVKDRYGNNVTNGTNVDFITTLGSVSPPSDATDEGMAVTTLTSKETTGTATVMAISGPAEGSVDVIFTVGLPFYISVVADPLNIALNGHTSNIQATVKDIGGNYVADGTEVTFSTNLGILGSDTVIKTTTSGVAEAVLTSETTAGTAVITATADSHYHTTKVVFSPDPPHNVTVTADPMAIPANGVSTSTVWATVIDQYGNMVADGITCYFSTTLGGVWPPLDTTLNGVAETTLTSSETPGLAAVTATCEGIPDTIYVSFYVPAFKIYLPTILKAY